MKSLNSKDIKEKKESQRMSEILRKAFSRFIGDAEDSPITFPAPAIPYIIVDFVISPNDDDKEEDS